MGQKLANTILFLTFGGLSTSCSSPKVLPKNQISSEKEVETKIEPIKSGPTLPKLENGLIDQAVALGLENIKSTHNYIVDWNGDGVEDLVILPEYYGPARFFEFKNGPKLNKFVEATYNPFGEVTRASFMAFADFNKDGLLDVVLGTLNQKTELNKDPLRLFIAKKIKGRISYQLKKDAFPSKIMPISSIGLIDFNMDGLLDIFVGNWFDLQKQGNKSAPDRLYQAKDDGLSFIDNSALLVDEHNYSDDLNIYPHATPTFGVNICDADQNGYPDIATAASSGYGNRLWLNLKDKSVNDSEESEEREFKDYGEQSKFAHDLEGAFSPLGGGNSFYALCHDYNNDGAIDFAIGELFHSYDTETRDRSAILTGISANFPPEYLRTEYHMDDGTGTWNQGDRRAVWVDINFDHNTDLLVENSGFPPKSRLVAFDQDESHAFADLAKDMGIDIVNPSGIATGDFNRDGRPDIFVGQVSIRNADIDPKLYVFENQYPWNGKRVVKIKLRGSKANYHGLGATVILNTDQGRYTKNVSYIDGGLPSQNSEGLFFGLAKGEKVKNVEVRWPYLKKDRSGRKYPYRKTYPLKNNFKTFKEVILKDF